MRPRRRRRLALGLAIAVMASLSLAQAASATFHEILVREVYAGAGDNDSYVVIQAYNTGQNLVGTHAITAYNATGGQLGTFTFSASVSNSANQMTILVADTAYATGFPAGPTPDGTFGDMNLTPSGGAICWNGTPDCVSWGNFSGVTTPAVAPPASPSGISAGMAIRRDISGGCATLLQLSDRTNNSQNDFDEVTPNPRSNASTITETNCVAPTPPETTIGTKPASATQSQTAEFTFSANPATGATFECKLDAGAFADCVTPFAATSLDGDDGPTGTQHSFEVRAKNTNGTDLSPAKHTWNVDLVAPVANLLTKPVDPSSGASASFTFNAAESATFQCELEGPKPSALATCASGKTFTTLPNGDYTFKLVPKDTAGNVGTATSYVWTVDNSLVDTQDPETTIKSGPPDPTDSATATFTYESNEPNSTFECSLDKAAFAACPAIGITYQGLGPGPHTFEVAAKDASGNKDETAAGYSFSVVAIGTPPVIPGPTPPGPVVPAPPAAPDTMISPKPPAKTKDRTPTVKFKATIAGATYQCKLDNQAYKPCKSPLTMKTLSFGKHTLKVKATAGGATDTTPASASFKVVRP